MALLMIKFIEVFVKIRNEPLFCDLQNNLDAMNSSEI